VSLKWAYNCYFFLPPVSPNFIDLIYSSFVIFLFGLLSERSEPREEAKKGQNYAGQNGIIIIIIIIFIICQAHQFVCYSYLAGAHSDRFLHIFNMTAGYLRYDKAMLGKGTLR
jgi:hypothetical protein